jgi:hypothetical protein
MPPRSAARLTDALLAVLGLAAGFVRDFSEDFHWHLVLGNYTLAHHALMRRDVLSHTFAGQLQHQDYWLADLALALAYKAFGYAGDYLLRGVALAALLVVLAREARALGLSAWAALLGPVLWLSEFVFRAYLRPETFTFPLLAGLLSLLGRHERTRDARNLWATLPLLVLWANVHSSVAIGLAVVGCYAAELAFRTIFALERRPRELQAALLLPVAAFAVTCVNPEGLREPLMFLNVTSADPTFESGVEWRPLALASMSAFFPWLLAFVVLSTLSALALVRRVSVWRTALFVLFLLVSVRHARFIKAALIVGVPLVAWNLVALRSRFAESAWQKRLGELGFAALLAGTAAASFLLFRVRAFQRELGTGLDPGAYPEAACRFAHEARLPGNLLNEFDFGSYLLFCLPEHPTYIDQRAATLFSPAFSREYRELPKDDALLERRVHDYRVGFAFLGYDPIAKRLAQKPLVWPLLYFDDLAQIYVRTELAGPDTPPAFDWLNPTYLASLSTLSGPALAQARSELARQQKRCPDCRITQLLGAALGTPAELDQTLAKLADDGTPELSLLRGISAETHGDLRTAIDAFNAAMEQGSDAVGAALWIDRTLARAGQNEQRRMLHEAVRDAAPEGRAQALALRELTRPL